VRASFQLEPVDQFVEQAHHVQPVVQEELGMAGDIVFDTQHKPERTQTDAHPLQDALRTAAGMAAAVCPAAEYGARGV
jgi:hypothetical protein